MKIKFGIQIGHDTAALSVDNPLKNQTGTSGELDLQKKVYFALSPLLQKAGLEVYYDDARCLNAPNMDYYLCPHFDGSTNVSYDGGFVDCNPDSLTKDKDWKFATIIADYYFSAMGIRFAPEHRTANSTYYYAFNYTGENTIQTIIELGTLTNATDKSKCQDYNKIARLLSEGIIAYLKKEDPRYITPPTPPPPVQDTTEIDVLRKSLETIKKEYEAFQIKTKDDLALLELKCQQIQNKYDTLVNSIKTLLV